VATEAQPAKQAKLLIVEDDVMTRVVLADMLCELGYTVAAEAASIDEALEATRKTDFDLAILDADLKGRSVSPVADARLLLKSFEINLVDIAMTFVAPLGTPTVSNFQMRTFVDVATRPGGLCRTKPCAGAGCPR
jgi:DNA-binding NarL/FixJ family response regulator